jgi:hypothetical protein
VQLQCGGSDATLIQIGKRRVDGVLLFKSDNGLLRQGIVVLERGDALLPLVVTGRNPGHALTPADPPGFPASRDHQPGFDALRLFDVWELLDERGKDMLEDLGCQVFVQAGAAGMLYIRR